MMNINLWRDDVLCQAILGYARKIDSFAKTICGDKFYLAKRCGCGI